MPGAMTFFGKIVDGRGTYVQLGVPGRVELPGAPRDWPEELCPGSLNFRVEPNGYPERFSADGQPPTVKLLDQGVLPACFEISQSKFSNNKLVSIPQMPNRGNAQVWRASLSYKERKIDCWVLRRYGSGLGQELEILSDRYMRKEYEIESETAANITLYPNGGAA